MKSTPAITAATSVPVTLATLKQPAKTTNASGARAPNVFVAEREITAAFDATAGMQLPGREQAFSCLPRRPGCGPMAVEPLLEDVETEAQWREWQLARQAADQKARTAERENLNRALYRFLLGNQAAAVKN